MQDKFIVTENVLEFNAICMELEDPASLIGPSLAMVTGPAGRGKSDTAEKYAINSDSAIYIPPMNVRSPGALLREITYELCMLKPGRNEACFEVIAEEMKKERRVIIIDEADLIPMQHLEMLRNLNQRFSCPIILMGENGLKRKVGSRQRIWSRIRRSLEFAPIAKADIALFFQESLGLELEAEVVNLMHKKAKGDWRPVLVWAVNSENAMRTNDLSHLPLSIVKKVIGQYEKAQNR